MQEIAGSEFVLPADLILLAMGFVGPRKAGLIAQAGVRSTSAATSRRHAELRHQRGRRFACGDMRRGQSLIVWAIREGRQCARAVDER
jgi:glutamate synthase (NADPH/NADH) small chain